MKLTIKANLDNDAFQIGGLAEVTAMITETLAVMEARFDEIAPGIMLSLRDANGNTVGFLIVEED